MDLGTSEREAGSFQDGFALGGRQAWESARRVHGAAGFLESIVKEANDSVLNVDPTAEFVKAEGRFLRGMPHVSVTARRRMPTEPSRGDKRKMRDRFTSMRSWALGDSMR